MNKLPALLTAAMTCASLTIMPAAQARLYPYVGLSLGQAMYDEVCGTSISASASSCEDAATTYKLYAGTKIDRSLAVEFAYVDMGEAEFTSGANKNTITATGLSASIFGIYPATYNLDLYVKAGGMYWEAEHISTASPGTPVATSDGLDLQYGVGMNYGINRELAIRAEYETTLRVGGVLTSGESPVSQITMGVSWYY